MSPPDLGRMSQGLDSTALPASGWGDPGIIASAPPTAFSGGQGSISWFGAQGSWWTSVPATVGDVIGSVTATVQDVAPSPLYIPGSAGDGGSQVTMTLVAQSSSGTVPLGHATSDGSGIARPLTVSLPVPFTVAAGVSLFVSSTEFALWPSSVMHPSTIGPIIAAPPLPPSPTPVTRLLFPPTTFVVDSSNLGFSYVSPVLVSGATISGASVSVSCPFYGFIQTCTRVHGGVAWNACGPAVACYGTAAANFDMQQLHVTDMQQFDIGVYSSAGNNTPAIAVVSFF